MQNLNTKFIVEHDCEMGDCLILGDVSQFSDLIINEHAVKCRGFYETNDNTITLYVDNLESCAIITKCIKLKQSYTDKYCQHSISDNYLIDFEIEH